MELPYNTTISRDLLKHGGQFEDPVAQWSVKRRWVAEAFEALERAGYTIGSAYTAVKDPAKARFLYRDRLWQGADMVGLGVASFGHINGVHVQNVDTWETYSAAIDRGEIPLGRAYRPTAEERMIREFVLQLKTRLGSPRATSRASTGVNVLRALSRSAGVARGRRPPRVGRRRTSSRSRGTRCCASTRSCRGSFSRSTRGFDIRRSSRAQGSGGQGTRAEPNVRASPAFAWDLKALLMP